jgi:hypothetical protein
MYHAKEYSGVQFVMAVWHDKSGIEQSSEAEVDFVQTEEGHEITDVFLPEHVPAHLEETVMAQVKRDFYAYHQEA